MHSAIAAFAIDFCTCLMVISPDSSQIYVSLPQPIKSVHLRLVWWQHHSVEATEIAHPHTLRMVLRQSVPRRAGH